MKRNRLPIDETRNASIPAAKTSSFLKDVLICSLGAYGGPEAHLGVFIDQLVAKRQHLTEEELMELLALCSILPGPTSTQTIVSIGYKTGGPLRALLTMLVWAMPALLAMTLLSFLYQLLSSQNLSSDFLRYIGPMAVGFIVLAAYRIGRKVVTDRLTLLLMGFGAAMTYLFHAPWVFPLVLVFGGAASIVAARETNIWKRTPIRPPWAYFAAFVLLASGLTLLSMLTDSRLIASFESFYRYGYLVFGGGQVVIPMMHGELVELRGHMTDAEFLTGYGLVQGLPGPMFSFAAYAGGMAARNGSILSQLLGAVAGGVGIFLPGLLLIYFIYPVWERVREIRGIRLSLRGVNAIAGGMISAAAILLIQKSGITITNLSIVIITVAILASRKVPAPLLVLATLILGVLI